MSEDTMVGRLLVATPSLQDPNFARTVVLVVDHGEHGALGVVLSRDTGVPVGEILPQWTDLYLDPTTIYRGGPVGSDAALGLVQIDPSVPLRSEGVIHQFTPSLGLVNLDADVEEVRADILRLRIFAGYAGWSAGQLEQEIQDDAWFVLPALVEDAFDPEADDLWPKVLSRQPHPLNLLASFPPDPTLN